MSRAASVKTGTASAPPPLPSPYRPETAEEFLSAHAAFMAADSAPAWLVDLRRAGAAGFAAEGLPNPRMERWKYTNLPPAVRGLGGGLAQAGLTVTDAAGVATLLRAGAAAPDWLRDILTQSPEGAQYRDAALWHMGQAYLRDIVVVNVPAGMIVEKPVEIAYATGLAGFAASRLVIRLGEGASLTLVERHPGGGDDRSWRNQTAQITVGRNARLRHYRLQESGAGAVHTDAAQVSVARDGMYEAFTLTTGAALSRNQVHLVLAEENSSCFLYGINMLRRKQLADTTITVEHRAPHCQSNQFYRTVLDGQARGVFQGKVHVHQAAQKTDGYQLSNALILSEGAEMDTKPELEIYADDVKCSHGATTGRLDEHALFYLRSRGLPEAEARGLLVQAFVHEIVEKLQDKTVEQSVAGRVAAWLA